MWTFWQKPVVEEYRARSVSSAGLFHFVCWFFNITLPLVIIFRSESGLWDKYSSYYDQATVQFQHEYLLKIFSLDRKEANRVDSVLATSNTHLIEELLRDSLDAKSKLTFASIDHQEIDKNQDGKSDLLTVTFEVPLDTDRSKSPVGFQLTLFFNYALSKRVKLSMDSLAYIEKDVPSRFIMGDGLSHVTLIGDLVLDQKVPMRMSNREMPEEAAPFPAIPDFMASEKFSESLLQYSSRNVSTSFRERLTFWHPISEPASETKLTISLHITYPLEKIDYETGFWHLIIWAWIQYLSLFVVLYCIIFYIRDFVFQHNLLGCLVYRSGNGSGSGRLGGCHKAMPFDRPLFSIERIAYK